MRFHALVLCLWLALVAPAWSEPAPDFQAVTSLGDTVRLSDFRGQVVLVDFWATWCPPCRKQLPQLANVEKEVADAVVLAVCVDKRPDRIRRFAKRVKLPSRVLLDPEGKIADRYNIRSMPWTVLIDTNGNVVWARPGLQANNPAALVAEVRRLKKITPPLQ